MLRPLGLLRLFAAAPNPVNDGAIGNLYGNGTWKSELVNSASPTVWVEAPAVVGATTIPKEVTSRPSVTVMVFRVVRVFIVVPPVETESGVL